MTHANTDDSTNAAINASNGSNTPESNRIVSSNVTNTIQQFGLQDTSDYDQANSRAKVTQNAVVTSASGTPHLCKGIGF